MREKESKREKIEEEKVGTGYTRNHYTREGHKIRTLKRDTKLLPSILLNKSEQLIEILRI